MPSLYPSLLGAAWTDLAVSVRRLHEGGVSARGVFRVRRGTTALARLLGAIMGMPAAGEGVPVKLAVTGGASGEVWTRAFAEQPLTTVQWSRGPLLVEAMGLFQCVFRLRADGPALVFEQVGTSFGIRSFTVPLPRFLSPSIEGRVEEKEDRAHVDVRIHAPIVGLLVAYDGLVTPGVERESS